MSVIHSMPHAVSVTTHGRLHLGFYNLSQGLPRQFGSVGLAIDAFQTRLTVRPGPQQTALPPWIAAIVERQLTAMQCASPMHVEIASAIPRHSGLGSGTQMALAIGTALQQLLGQPLPAEKIAAIQQRGARSGIGIATFAQGGCVIDGGRGSATQVPPCIAQVDFPADWHLCLVLEQGLDGLHGAGEKSAFQQLTPPSAAETQRMQAALIAQGIPALIERDFAGFSGFVADLQRYNANYFAPAQGGAYASPRVANVMAHCEAWGHVGVGQTSWGPTGFVLCESRAAADALQAQCEQHFAAQPTLQFKVTAAVNQPAVIL